ncbi:glutathionyl-hydroquinone reductase YqjG-like [Pecten maximus]|uniref:glutathionyl-hydroquinone reductase YqjG-like n=1 Tax=Pecten maximus TaxID=6579 RepID=UPI001457E5CA|nr:glutathionyl-hydroquinone reductase YqjG-like [Pecten maximus]
MKHGLYTLYTRTRMHTQHMYMCSDYTRFTLTDTARQMADNDPNAELKFPTSTKGEFVRTKSVFRDWITADGSSAYKSESGRYHLYASLACPWAHRALAVRKLKGLEQAISYDVVDWFLDGQGWSFTDKKADCTFDTVNGCSRLREVYQIANPDYDGRITVPVLWDKQQKTIVNNESSEIIWMFNSEFNGCCSTAEQRMLDFYPETLRKDIDGVIRRYNIMINNGVYRSGFATSQEAYDAAVREVFEGLDKVQHILSKTRYLTGSNLTEADIRLFTTLIRFDLVYVGHFKCNKRIIDYPNMWGYLRELCQIPGVADTVNLEHVTKHYMASHAMINPTRIVSIGPDIDFTTPHGREAMQKT